MMSSSVLVATSPRRAAGTATDFSATLLGGTTCVTLLV